MSEVLTSAAHDYPFFFAGRRPSMDAKDRFYRQFQAEATNIQEHIAQLGSIARVGGERQDAIESILASISKLSNEVTDASDFVPAYDQRTYAQAVKALTDQLNEETARLAPKTKFQFKPRAAKTGEDGAAPKEDARILRGAPVVLFSDQSPAVHEEPDAVGDLPSFPKNYNEEMSRPGGMGIRKPSFSAARDINISDHKGLHIILPSTASRATSSGSLTDLEDCIVDMSVPTTGAAAFLSLALKNISRSLIVAGHVSGPAHVTGIQDSVLVVAARQVRIHECKNVDVYLYCTSRPIIEDCSSMKFAPLPNCYMSQNEEAGQNQWDQVDDFKWLKADHSPNWSILPEGDRLPEETWTNTVPGGPGVGTGDILKQVGIGAK